MIINGAFAKFLENVRNRLILDFNKVFEYNQTIKQQSKLTFNGFLKAYTNYSSYTFKQNEVTMVKPIYVGFAIFEMIKLHMYET